MGKLNEVIYLSLLYSISFCSAQGPIVEVQAVVKETAHLPCDIKPPTKNDIAILVVWYRNEMDAIYSYDSRGKLSEVGSHWKNSSVVGNRAFFRTMLDPAILSVEEIQPADGGMYRCRVDFRKSPTKNNKIKLNVIVPPDELLIYDSYGKQVTSVAGPYEEGKDVKLRCKAYGGNPKPTIRWWRGETLLKSNSIIGRNDVIESELIVKRISRSDLKAAYTCQATNNNISLPKTSTVLIDIYLSPLEVSILSSRQALSAERKYEIVCQVVGSRPPAKITWSKGIQKLNNFTDEVSSDGNVTTSTLNFIPTVEDHNMTLTCRAINLKIKTGVGEDKWILDITFVPVPTLAYGPQLLKPNDIEEGDDVYFHCKVEANPRAYKVVWKHNGFVVQNDPKSGVLASYDSLILRSVNKDQAGSYSCFASNVEGDAESNVVELRIKYKPVCKTGQKLTYGIIKEERANISCEVDSYPMANTYTWWLVNGSDEIHQNRNQKYIRGRNLSFLQIHPKTDFEYGVLKCSATNSIGDQIEPCIFKIVPAGRPDKLINCTITNQTDDSIVIGCIAGYDGGQRCIFILEVYDEESGLLLTNMSSSVPYFIVKDLSPGMTITMNLYAENVQGKSPHSVVQGFTLNAAEKRTGIIQSSLNLTPYVALLLGITTFCAISTIIVLGAVRAHSSATKNRYSTTLLRKSNFPASLNSPKLDTIEEDENNPDIIPTSQVLKDTDGDSGGGGGPYKAVLCVSSKESDGKSPVYHYQMVSQTNSSVARRQLLKQQELELEHQLTNSCGGVGNNEDICRKHTNVYLNKKQTEDDLECKSENDKGARILKNDGIAFQKNSLYTQLEEDAKNSIQRLLDSPRMCFHKEIVTVRIPPMLNEPESCV